MSLEDSVEGQVDGQAEKEPTEDEQSPQEQFCDVHPSLTATGVCSVCKEPRCAICFEDGKGGACRDCVPSPASIGRIRPNLRMVRRRPRRRLSQGPLWIAAGFIGYYALATGLLFIVSWADGHFAWRLGLSSWARFHKEDLVLAALIMATAMSFVRRRRPVVADRK